MGRAPVLFVGHGAPLLALDPGRGEPLLRWGRALPRPRAVLAVSAHWEGTPLTLGTTRTRDLVYDFSGFPDELYRVRYPAPPAPEVALRVESLAGPVARSDRGLDHGVWTPLVHLFPRADVPVLQLSMPRSATSSWLFDLGRRLAPLRDEDVLLLASGNLVHNLSRASWGEPAPTPPWAEAFDSWIRGVLERRDLDALLDYERCSPDVEEAHPTREHFRPLLVAAGAGAEDGVTFPVTGWEMGSISRRSAQFG